MSLAGLLRTVYRSSDIVSRSGGEEFVIFLPETQLPDAAATAERIRNLVETSVFPYAGYITVSAGVAALIDVQGSTEGLFRQADMTLYEAKGADRNIVIISTPEGMIINASEAGLLPRAAVAELPVKPAL